ncbi:hypothetical protein D3C78_1436680 [compost metagenome]
MSLGVLADEQAFLVRVGQQQIVGELLPLLGRVIGDQHPLASADLLHDVGIDGVYLAVQHGQMAAVGGQLDDVNRVAIGAHVAHLLGPAHQLIVGIGIDQQHLAASRRHLLEAVEYGERVFHHPARGDRLDGLGGFIYGQQIQAV